VADTHDEISQKRAAATQAIVDSSADKKLIVAGPGTGKTFTFRQALEVCGGRGLAITFIRNLVADLREALEDIADVFTFHGFCKYQLHRHPPEGLDANWHYYPPLLELVAYDLGLVGGVWTKEGIERALHTLDDSTGAISEALRLGGYYNAVSHTDVVYRALRHFTDYPDQLPAYPLIVVDEYQDFSEMETAFIGLLATRSKVLIAGDDDQALYSFKNADARFIRELASGGEYTRFPLPYCSRCTDVVVAAVNDVLTEAMDNGNLDGRLDKEFECFVPDKADDSHAHPKIIHATCSVQSKKAPYVGRYIVEQIAAISGDEITESHDEGYPTVLVVGPNPFLDAAFSVIRQAFPQAVRRKSQKLEIDPLDGYRYLAKDERSRLGWRIILACDAFDDSDHLLAEVAGSEAELAELLPAQYRDHHLELAHLVARLLDDEELADEEIERLVGATGRSLEEILAALHLAETNESPEVEDLSEQDEGGDVDGELEEPSIICTSLIGSKGLSAGHVFIVGFNNGHLPRDPYDISDDEVCQFVVGLSRTRKACHVISVRRYGKGWLEPSEFAKWIAPHVDGLKVDKA
jgi:superfamily I DNA/RNA helicase